MHEGELTAEEERQMTTTIDPAVVRRFLDGDDAAGEELAAVLRRMPGDQSHGPHLKFGEFGVYKLRGLVMPYDEFPEDYTGPRPTAEAQAEFIPRQVARVRDSWKRWQAEQEAA